MGTTKILSIKAIAAKIGVSTKTIQRLEERGVIILRRTQTGLRYCFRSDIAVIRKAYFNL